jgi:preprotein translocase subunit SecA
LWQEHLYEMDSLRYSIGLRGHGQRDPLLEYKAEAFKMFDELMVSVKTEICHNIFRSASSMMAFENFRRNLPPTITHQPPAAAFPEPPKPDQGRPSDIVSQAAEDLNKPKPKPVRSGLKVGRNDPCPCGSGKKFKNCCGR